jgi:uncharacterized protein DUF6911
VEARGEKLGNLSDGALIMESKKKAIHFESFSPMRGRYQVNVSVELSDIEKQIRDVGLGLSGHMSLDNGEHRLGIRADPGKYLITLSNDEDDVIANYWNKSAREGEKIVLAGDYWGSGMICTDVNQVVEIALKFCETGKLSRSADWHIDEDLVNEEDLLEPL